MNTRNLLVSVLMLVSVMLSACLSPSGGAPAATPSTSMPVSPTLTATDVASAVTTVSSKLFQIPMSVSVGPSWTSHSSKGSLGLMSRSTNLFIDFLIVDNVSLLESGDPPRYVSFPDDFVGYLQSNAFWSEITPAALVSVGGAEGYQIDVIGTSTTSSPMGFLSFNDAAFKEFVAPQAQKFRFIYFENVSGNRLLIVVGTNDPDLLSITQFDAILPNVQEVLDTVTFGG
jgi:hypothetical protein